MKDITAIEFVNLNPKSTSLKIIDVREELEYQTFNLGGENIPLGKLLRDIDDLEYDKGDEIIVLCQRGLRSETAKRALQNKGYRHVKNLIGGILAIRKLNL